MNRKGEELRGSGKIGPRISLITILMIVIVGLCHSSSVNNHRKESNEDYPILYDHYRVEEQKFESGMRLVFVEDESMNSIQFCFRVAVGTFDEKKSGRTSFPEGVAHLLEHSILLNMTADDRLKFRDRNAYTLEEETNFHFDSYEEHFIKNFELAAGLIFNYRENPKTLDEVNQVNSE